MAHLHFVIHLAIWYKFRDLALICILECFNIHKGD